MIFKTIEPNEHIYSHIITLLYPITSSKSLMLLVMLSVEIVSACILTNKRHKSSGNRS